MSGAEAVRQSPPESAAGKTWDAVVVGAGPAGAAAAVQIARAGHSALIVDRQEFPREKVCGDGIIADTIKCLRRLGLYDTVREEGRHIGSTVVYSPSRIELRVEGEFFTLQRRRLDHILAKAAIESGAHFVRGEATALSHGEDGDVEITLKGLDAPVRARTAVLATGADGALLRALAGKHLPHVSAMAVRCYIESPSPLDHLLVSFDRSIIPGYAWIFPLPGGAFNVGCGVFSRGGRKERVNLREMFHTFLREFPVAHAIAASSTATSPLKGAPLRCGFHGASPHLGTRILAAGETMGTTFPFTGEGIGKAMETGEMAGAILADALSSGDFTVLASYGERLDKEIKPRYLGYKVAEDWLSHGWLNDFLASRAIKSPFLSHALEGVINETDDPREVFSLGGILRSFWS